MRVLLTGGTGFVGSHAAQALLAEGHELRLLVRDPVKLERVFSGRGLPMPEHVVGELGGGVAAGRVVDRAGLPGLDTCCDPIGFEVEDQVEQT